MSGITYSIDSIKTAMSMYDDRTNEFANDVEANDYFEQFCGKSYEIDGKMVEFVDQDGVVVLMTEDVKQTTNTLCDDIITINGVAASRTDIIDAVTNKYIENHTVTMDDIKNDIKLAIIRSEIIDEVQRAFDLYKNTYGRKLKGIDGLTVNQIASLLAATGDFRRLETRTYGHAKKALLMKCRNGEHIGTYIEMDIQSGDGELAIIAKSMNPDIKKPHTDVLPLLLRKVEPATVSNDDMLVACGNGVFDFRRKEQGLTPYFTEYTDENFEKLYPEFCVLSKLYTNYNANAKNVVIHNDEDGTDWDVESQFEELFDNKTYTKALWQVAQFTLRKCNRPKILVLFANSSKTETGASQGQNGKSTILRMLIYVIDGGVRSDSNVLNTSLTDIGDNKKQFTLAGLPYAYAIISHEANIDSKTKISNCDTIKNIIRGDGVQCNRKFKDEVNVEFKGNWIQAFNGNHLNFEDSSESMWNRTITIPFEKFFGNTNRKYISEEYTKRQDVREYILWRVLDGMERLTDYSDDVKALCGENTRGLEANSKPAFGFFDEYMHTLKNKKVAVQMLFDAFLVYDRDINGSMSKMKRSQFVDHLNAWTHTTNTFKYVCVEKGQSKERWKREDRVFAEPIIAEFGSRMDGWQDANDTKNEGYVSTTKTNATAFKDFIIRIDEDFENKQNDIQRKHDEKSYKRFVKDFVFEHLDKIVSGFMTKDDTMTFDEWMTNGKPMFNDDLGKFTTPERHDNVFVKHNTNGDILYTLHIESEM